MRLSFKPQLQRDPFIVGSAITGFANLFSNLFNTTSQAQINADNQNFAREMYALQRKDALADWDMMNAYNSPAKQMERYKAAGLNPNLIYGQSNPGAVVRSSTPTPGNSVAPKLDLTQLGNVIGYALDLRAKKENINNMEKAREEMHSTIELNKAKKMLTDAETARTLTGNSRDQFELGLRQRIGEYDVQAAHLGNLKTSAEIEKTYAEKNVLLNRDEREAAMNSVSIKEAVARILKLNAETTMIPAMKGKLLWEISNLDRDQEIKKAEVEARKKGYSMHDALPLRWIGEAVDKVKKRLGLK